MSQKSYYVNPNEFLHSLIIDSILHYIELTLDNTKEKIDKEFLYKTVVRAIWKTRELIQGVAMPEEGKIVLYEDSMDVLISRIYESYISGKDKAEGTQYYATLHNYNYNEIIEYKNLNPVISLYNNNNLKKIMRGSGMRANFLLHQTTPEAPLYETFSADLKNILKERSPLIDEVNRIIEESRTIPGTTENELIEKVKNIIQLPENASPESIESLYALRADKIQATVESVTKAVANSDVVESIKNVSNSTLHTVIDNIENVTESSTSTISEREYKDTVALIGIIWVLLMLCQILSFGAKFDQREANAQQARTRMMEEV